MKRNRHLQRLPPNYLFLEIERHKRRLLETQPNAKVISLGIGDTTLPLPQAVAEAMAQAAKRQATPRGYQGYGPALGSVELRAAINARFYGNRFSLEELSIADGAKCDVGRLQVLFGAQSVVAVQDPAYPVYVDTSLMMGLKPLFLPCTPENDFFPDLSPARKADLLYFCSPNNPTGAAATFEQLETLVTFARQHRLVIVYDAAYAPYIRQQDRPRSIYEIPGAEEVAIELHSFSKLAGFTGVRLSWSVVPKALCYRSGEPVLPDWHRIVATFFNGPSSIAQAGGLACLEEPGWSKLHHTVQQYRENGRLIREALTGLGLEVYGGVDAPYVWARFPGQTSWESFQYLLEELYVVTTPGVGFGPSGEGFLRFSGLATPETVRAAIRRLSSTQLKASPLRGARS